jgi:GT2 family glycosyltransferase
VSTEPISATVVVATFNGAGRGLDRCLAALRDQQQPPGGFDVVVVDDGSTDGTADLARSFGFTVVQHPGNLGVGAARQTGVQHAAGDVVAFVDDDVVPDRVWLCSLLAPFSAPDVLAVGGRVVGRVNGRLVAEYFDATGYGCPAPMNPAADAGAWARFREYLRASSRGPLTEAAGPLAVQDVYTANAAYRLSALLQIGGFDPSLRAGEDTDVSYRLHRQYPTGRLMYSCTAVVEHGHLDRLGPLLRTNYRRATAALQLARKQQRQVAVFPLPLLAAGLVVTGTAVAPTAGVGAALISPPVLYSWWVRRPGLSLRHRAGFPFVQLLAEGATDLGLLAAWMSHRRSTTPRPHRR